MDKAKSESSPNQQISVQQAHQAEQPVQKKGKNIDSFVRPIIERVQAKIQPEFLKLHNQYLLQGLKRKADCYHKFIKPIIPNPEPTKNNQNSKNQQISQNQKPQISAKASPEQVLQYYNCFDEQIAIGNTRYQKLSKKTEENKFRLLSCIDKCSGHSKEQNDVFQKCADKCKTTYIETITKLYTNFYNKFLDQQ